MGRYEMSTAKKKLEEYVKQSKLSVMTGGLNSQEREKIILLFMLVLNL